MSNGLSQELAESLYSPARLQELASSGLLDSPPEEAFDNLTRLVAQVVGTPISLVSLVTSDRQFFKSQTGLSGPVAAARGTPLSHSFCQHVVAGQTALVVADAREHPMLRDNLAIRDLQVIAYLGVPLTTSGGQCLGSFCAIDTQPRSWTARDLEVLHAVGRLAVDQIELRLIAKQVQLNFTRLRELEMHREELTHMLVHDLRNPLSSLIGALDLAAMDDDLSPDVRNVLETASESAGRLADMVTDILDLGKAEAGRLRLERAPTAPVEVVEEVARYLEGMARLHGVTLAAAADAGLAPVSLDRELIRRVLVNLAANALQHTPKGGRVAVRAVAEAGAVRFEVEDNGQGIPPSVRPTLFEKFGANGGQGRRYSTGLGLPFSKMAVEAHGGTLALESEMGRGTRFFFSLPSAPA